MAGDRPSGAIPADSGTNIAHACLNEVRNLPADQIKAALHQCEVGAQFVKPMEIVGGTGSVVNSQPINPEAQRFQQAREASSANIPFSRMLSETEQELAGTTAAPSNIGTELEVRALWHGDRWALTPRDLGSEGCMAAPALYAIGPALKERGINTLDAHGRINTKGGQDVERIQASDFFLQAISNGQSASLSFSGQKLDTPLSSITLVSQSRLKDGDIQAGDIVIGVKPSPGRGAARHVFDGNQIQFDYHTAVASAIPTSWGNFPGGIMLNGNTGLDMTNVPGGGPHDPHSRTPGTAPHFRTAQEVMGPNTDSLNSHHHQLNSNLPTNPYLGGYFYIVRLKDVAPQH